MASKYVQLSLEDRCTIAGLREAGQSYRQIAAALGRAASTVTREVKRNQGAQVGYRPGYAFDQAWARRWRGSRLERVPELREEVLARLASGHSPEQVAGRLRLEQGRTVISPESIYRFVYAQIRRTNDTDWRNYLPRRKYKRGYRRPGRTRSPMKLIPHRVPLSERPADVSTRHSAGHWEADLMQFAASREVLLVAQERASRLLVVRRQPSKAAAPTLHSLEQCFGQLPAELRRSLTLDNGAEFTYHHQLHRLGLQTFFCDTHAPWQKGGIENAIGRLRRALPRKIPRQQLQQPRLNNVVALYNQTPRKCLDFYTPEERFLQHLLHFKCESTPRLRSE
jgi:IS30 family transposase